MRLKRKKKDISLRYFPQTNMEPQKEPSQHYREYQSRSQLLLELSEPGKPDIHPNLHTPTRHMTVPAITTQNLRIHVYREHLHRAPTFMNSTHIGLFGTPWILLTFLWLRASVTPLVRKPRPDILRLQALEALHRHVLDQSEHPEFKGFGASGVRL